ncbi:MAG: acetylacetone-cleaving protein [Proteobacteria bacterium]|jgi:acetylacetone-cleaving enzyme|nr:acetylacetone-cleaving protein [Pseudomonadota bacterium]
MDGQNSPVWQKGDLAQDDYVKLDDFEWQPFPEEFSKGGIRWKLLHVSPESGAWAAIYDCPAGSSFNAHIHIGPGEYFLTKGRMEVRGGEGEGGATAEARSYGYEPCNARHDMTNFTEDSEFYMTFLGPLKFIGEDDEVLAVVGWEESQALWLEQIGAA